MSEVADILRQGSSERGNLETKPERQTSNELHLFAGCGGGILGGILLGHHIVCAVEIEPYCRKVLLQRQRDGVLPRFPIWDDVRTFDGKPWRGRVDVVCGGFPCQDTSAAGKGAGIEGERSGLWGEMARIISDVAPRWVFVENSPMLTVRGLGRVLGDLARMGFHSRYGVLGGYTAGGCADGKRIWILAHATDSLGWFAPQIQAGVTDSKGTSRREFERAISACASEEAHAGRFGDSDGVARDVDRLRAAGNGQRPELVALAWRVLSGGVRFREMRVGLPRDEDRANVRRAQA